MKAFFEEHETKTFQLAGSRFYYQGGDDSIEVKINSGGDSRSFVLQSGQGINSDDRFGSVQITNSGVDQEVEFEVTDREIFDNRIPGSMTIAPEGGVMPVVQTEVVEVSPVGGVMPVVSASAVVNSSGFKEVGGGERVMLLPANTNRVKALLRFKKGVLGGKWWVGESSAAVNFLIDDGSHLVYENTDELWVLNEGAIDGQVFVMEDLR